MSLEIGSANVGLSPSLSNSIASSRQEIATGRRDPFDNPAGIQVTLQFNSQIDGNQTAIRNSNDGISALQVAQGGVGNITDSLQQLRELSVQAGNGTLNSGNRAALQEQADQLLLGIKDTLQQSTFNGKSLINEAGALSLQTGPDSEQTQSVTRFDLTTQLEGLDLFSLDLTSGDTQAAFDSIDQSLDLLGEVSAEFGAGENRLASTINTLSVNTLNESAARSRIEDSDMAAAVSQLAQDQVKQQAEIAMLGQANANRAQVLSLLN